MDTVDSRGRVTPLTTAEERMVSKKVVDKDGQEQEPHFQRRQKTVKSKPSEEDESTQAEKHVIDIVV